MRTQTYRGGLHYSADVSVGAHQLLVAIPCRIGGLPDQFHALLDTGGTWCVLPPQLAEAVGCDLEGAEPCRLHTRFGLFAGVLVREWLTFEDENTTEEPGQSVQVAVEATWFVCSDWPGPIVIGWKGCLERMRFGFDPSDDLFCFAELVT